MQRRLERELDRDTYEKQVADRLDQLQRQIDRLRAEATDRNVPENVGDEHTQVEKLQGQLEMTLTQFKQLRAVDTMDAWHELRPGVDQKLDRLEDAVVRTQDQIEDR